MLHQPTQKRALITARLKYNQCLCGKRQLESLRIAIQKKKLVTLFARISKIYKEKEAVTLPVSYATLFGTASMRGVKGDNY